jgi:DNA-directed RNA polymerase subunit RPC12/RpoP
MRQPDLNQISLETVSYSCSRCGQNVEVLEHLRHLITTTICPDCSDFVRETQANLDKSNKRAAEWERLCPPDFRNTVVDRLPRQTKTNEALEWTYGGKGLNLWGVPDTGKTRTCWLILQREHFRGRRILAFCPGDFDGYYEAVEKKASWIRSLARVDLMLFDDVDKYGMSYQAEKAFFTVLDTRLRYHRPTLFTGNSDGEKLELKFREGPALVKRIRQSSKSIHFK